jgi:hypothetical protein
VSLAAFLSQIAVSGPRPAAQSKPTSSETAMSIQLIRQQYAAINKAVRRYKKVKKELSGFSLEGGELFAYFDGPAIVKIVANHFGEMGRASEEYYYAKGKLIFGFRKDYRYNRPMSGKVVSTQENRFYFQDDGLVRWINETGKPVSPGMAEYPLKEDEYRETSRKFLDGARSKNAIIEADE